MITAIFGLPGAGKTTFLAAIAERAARNKPLRCGRVWLQAESEYPGGIWSNAPIKGTNKLNSALLGKFGFSGSLLLIDESVMIADSRDYKTLDKSLMLYMKQHRKYHCDIILASQGARDNDLRIRDLYEQILYCYALPFGRSRLSTVRKTVDIDKTISERYELGGFFEQWTIRRKRYYPLFDTDYIHGYKLPPPPMPEKW